MPPIFFDQGHVLQIATILLQSATIILQKVLQKAVIITKCDDFISKCDSSVTKCDRTNRNHLAFTAKAYLFKSCLDKHGFNFLFLSRLR